MLRYGYVTSLTGVIGGIRSLPEGRVLPFSTALAAGLRKGEPVEFTDISAEGGGATDLRQISALPEDIARGLDARRHLGRVIRLKSRKGYGLLSVTGQQRATYFRLSDANGPITLGTTISFVQWDSLRGPVAERLKLLRPGPEVAAEQALPQVAPLFAADPAALHEHFTLRGSQPQKSRALRSLESLVSAGVIDPELLDRSPRDLARSAELFRVLAKYLIPRRSDALITALRTGLPALIELNVVEIFILAGRNPQAFSDEMVLAIVGKAMDAYAACQGRRREIFVTATLLDQIARFLRVLLHKRDGSVADLLPWCLTVLVDSDVRKNGTNRLRDLFNVLLLLREEDPELGDVLYQHLPSIGPALTTAEIAKDLRLLTQLCRERRVVTNPRQLVRIVAANLSALTRSEGWTVYVSRIESLRKLFQRKSIVPIYLLSVNRYPDPRRFLDAFEKLAGLTEARSGVAYQPETECRFRAVEIKVDEHGLRAALDALTNPRFTQAIEDRSIPRQVLESIDLAPGDLKRVRSIVSRGRRVITAPRFMDADVSRMEIVAWAQSLADDLNGASDISDPQSALAERVGARLQELIDDVSRGVNANRLTVVQNALPFRDVFHDIQACLFNDRRFTADGVRMALDPYTHLLFIRALLDDSLVRTVAFAVTLECKDASGGLHFVVDGLEGSESLLGQLHREWTTLFIAGVEAVARKSGFASVGYRSDLANGSAIERVIWEHIRKSGTGSEQDLVLRKRGPDEERYNVIWSSAGGGRSMLKGHTRLWIGG